MAYQTGVATNMDDLLSKLGTFAVANGWTQDELNTTLGKFALHKNSVYVSCRYDPASEDYLSVHQALGFTGGNEPGTHTDDSGNGYNTSSSHSNANLSTERAVSLGNGAYPSYHFFEKDASPAYIHVVVEKTTAVYRHFGFGELSKIGDWTGGEYAYGQTKLSAGPLITSDTCGLDGLFLSASWPRRAATVRVEGLPGEGGSSKWGQIWGTMTGTNPLDSGSNAKVYIQGGHRGGPIARNFGFIGPAGSQSGLINMYPVGLFYKTGTDVYLLGFHPDVRGMNTKYFAKGDEVVVGSDTWVVFPQSQVASAGASASRNAGIAYLKVTA